ncbi:MAG TPA: enoyl-CoA hydratase [Candidatus Polarisedimenticolia bacterium]|nr:enoyl-CoA hydratase [Candidatus Polarisedimenticolia bacterium]
MSSPVTPATTEPVVLREEQGGVVRLTLNRPRQLNSLSRAMIDQLQQELDAIGADHSARVVVIAGAGNNFCAGHDLKEMRAMNDRAALLGLFRDCSRMMLTLRRIPQPVIARVQGIATAAGCQLVAMCDLVVASDTARFAVSGINVGLFCSTPGVALSRAVGRKPALEMLFTGEFIDAAAAERRGLVNRVVPAERLDDEVAGLAAAIVAKSPAAIASGKRLFYEQADLGIEAAYERAADVMAADMLAPDAAEGIDAFLAKRPPRWRGIP